MTRLGRPRHHRRKTGSTNSDAVAAAAAGAPHGTLCTAAAQSAGRGRQGRQWSAPPGQALLMSLVLRSFDELLPLRAGLAVADVAGPQTMVKWPNDVLLDGRKVAGILAEASPRHGWAVIGIGVNVAVEVDALPAQVRDRAATLGLRTDELEPLLDRLLGRLAIRLGDPAGAVLATLRQRDALLGRTVTWSTGRGTGEGVDAGGQLIVRQADGGRVVLGAGEVHLQTASWEPVDP